MPRKLALLGGTTNAADCGVVLTLLATPWRLLQGPDLAEYETEFARRIGVRHAISFSAGRVGLYGVLKGLGIGAGDEVLLQLPTHIVVPNAITYTGARPVYVDCDPSDFNIDVAAAERQVTPATRAIVLQHTFGAPADLDAVMALAARHGLAVIEDCVHALGSTYRGKPVGGHGVAGFFSTEETKTISTTMGGMVVTDDDELARSLRAFQESCAWPTRWLVARYLLKLLAYHLLTEPHVHYFARAVYEGVGRRHPLPKPTNDDELRGRRPRGFEQRLSAAQARLGLRQLQRLEENLAHRRRLTAAYEQALRPHGVRMCEPRPEAEPSLVRFPVWTSDKEAAVAALDPYVVAGTWFTSVMEEAVDPTSSGYVPGSCPQAEAVARHLVNLPTHGRVTTEDVPVLTRALLAAAQGSSGPQVDAAASRQP